MPRQQTLQIEGRPILEAPDRQVFTQTVARPVDTYTQPAADPRMHRIASFLEAGEELVSAMDLVDTKQGAQDRALGMPKKETVLGSYERGWLTLDGSIKGQQDAEKVRTSFASGFNRNAPGGLESWIQERQRELMQGMKPGPFADAYRVKLAQGFQSLRDQHSQEQRAAVTATVENNAVTLLAGAARAKGAKGEVVTAEDFLGVRRTLAESGLGFDDVRMDKLGHAALKLLAGEGNVQAVRAARKAAQDGTMAFPTLGEDELSALEGRAITVRLNKEEAADKAIKEEHETKVNESMFTIIQMAQAGRTKDAQKAFDGLVSTDLFAHEPHAIEKWQRMLVNVGDKADSIEQVELLNHVTLNILTQGWGLREIQASGLSPRLMRDAFLMHAQKRREDRQEASEARAAARADAAAAKAARVTSTPDFKSIMDATMASIPKKAMSASNAYIDGETGHPRANAMAAIRADAERELLRTALARGSDIEGWNKDVVRIRDSANLRIQQVANTANSANIRPAFIRHGTWAEYMEASKRGEYGANLSELEEARKWFHKQGPK